MSLDDSDSPDPETAGSDCPMSRGRAWNQGWVAGQADSNCPWKTNRLGVKEQDAASRRHRPSMDAAFLRRPLMAATFRRRPLMVVTFRRRLARRRRAH